MEKENPYAAWIAKNEDKQGTKEFEEVKQSFMAERAKRIYESSTFEKTARVASGFNAGLADIIGAPVDLMNWLLPESMSSDYPVGGSKSIRGALAAGDMTYQDVEDLPYDQRPYARGGEVAGQTVGAFAPVAGMAGKVTPAMSRAVLPPAKSTARTMGRDIVRTTARNPGQVAALEGAAGVGAGLTGGTAEALYPGDTTARMHAELAGAFAVPIIATQVLPRATRMIMQQLRSFSPAGRETAAGKKIGEALTAAGESPKDIVAKLKAEVGSQTSGQATGSPTLLAIENQMVKELPEQVGQEVAAQTKSAINEFNVAFRQANKSGDPALVQEAAKARIEWLKKTLDARVGNAEVAARDASAAILARNPEDAVKASREARDILDFEVRIARSTESKLWNEINKKAPVGTQNFEREFKSMKDELLEEETISAPIEALYKRVVKNQNLEKPILLETGDMLRSRSRALDLASEARVAGKFGDARRLQRIADGMLDDLSELGDAAVLPAREFSRDLNQKFTEGFVGKTLGYEKTGAKAVAPEMTLETAARGSDVQQSLNLQAMEKATLRSVDTMEAASQTENMKNIQKAFMTQIAAQTADPSGAINLSKLDNFIANNPLTLKQLGLTDALTDVASKRRLADMLKDTATKGRAFADKQSEAAKILGANNLNEVVTRALGSPHRKAAFEDLARVARKSGDPETFDGLRFGVLDTILTKATKATKGGDLISGDALSALLKQESKGKTLRQTLLDTKVLTPQQSKNLNTLIAKTQEFEAALATTARTGNILGEKSVMFNLFNRLLGSNIGSLSAVGRTNPLLAAGAGSQATQKLLEKIPRLKLTGVVAQAVKDPKFMAMLLQKTAKDSTTPNFMRMRAYLVQNGLMESEPMHSEVKGDTSDRPLKERLMSPQFGPSGTLFNPPSGYLFNPETP